MTRALDYATTNTDPTELGYVDGVISPLKFRGAMSILPSTSLPSSVDTAVAWTGEEYDTSDIYDAGSNTRLTVPAGVTKVRLTYHFTLSPRSDYESVLVQIKRNGTNPIEGCPAVNHEYIGGGSIAPSITASSAVLPVTGGDYFEVYVYQVNTAAASASFAATPSGFSLEVVE